MQRGRALFYTLHGSHCLWVSTYFRSEVIKGLHVNNHLLKINFAVLSVTFNLLLRDKGASDRKLRLVAATVVSDSNRPCSFLDS